MNDPNTQRTHVAREIPLSLIFGLLVQAGMLVWTIAVMNSAIDQNATAIDQIMIRQDRGETRAAVRDVTLARIDENLKIIRATLEKIVRNP